MPHEKNNERCEEIYAEAESIAALRHCFTEGDITSLDDPKKSW